MHFRYNQDLIQKAKELRRNLTPQEAKLWFHYLHDYPIRFLHQKVLDDYILDFYCSKARLCVETDGNHHLSRANEERDAVRSGELSKLGILTVRFSNEQVDLNFSEVCKEIDRIVHKRISK